MLRKLIRLNKTGINYFVTGKGKPVVFLHGLTGSASSWLDIIQRLSKTKTFTYIVPDLPGIGYAGRLNVRYTFDTDVEFLFYFLERITHEKIVLVGDSSSGVISVKFAIEHPHKVEKLILIETPFYFSHEKLKFFLSICLDAIERFKILQAILKKIIDSDKLLYFFWHLLWPKNKFLPTFSQNRDVLTLRKSSVKAYAQGLEDLLKIDLRNEVSKLKIPTLIITGEKDFWVPVSVARDIAQRMPSSKLIILKDISHGGFDNSNELIRKEILGFLKQALPLLRTF